VELTLKRLTTQLGPRPTFPRSSESLEEFKLRRRVWKQSFLLFTIQHRRRRRLERVVVRERLVLTEHVAGPDTAVTMPSAGHPEVPRVVARQEHRLRLEPMICRPLPVAQRIRADWRRQILCVRSRTRGQR
jgi:hypothetical protein